MNIPKTIWPVLLVSTLLFTAPARAMSAKRVGAFAALSIAAGYFIYTFWRSHNTRVAQQTVPKRTNTKKTVATQNNKPDKQKKYNPIKKLYSAATSGNIEQAELHLRQCLERGISIDSTKGRTESSPLIAAAYYNHLNIVELLLNSGADANHKNDKGATALLFATQEGHLPIVEKLIEHGASIDEQDIAGGTALMRAAAQGNEGIVRLLLAHGADIHLKNDRGYSALEMAAIFRTERSNTQIILPFIDHLAQTEILSQITPDTISYITTLLSMKEILGNRNTNLQILQALGSMSEEDIETLLEIIPGEGNVLAADGTIVNIRAENDERARLRNVFKTTDPFYQTACRLAHKCRASAETTSTLLAYLEESEIILLLATSIQMNLESNVAKYNQMMGRT